MSNNDIKTDYLQGLMRQDIKRLTTKEEHALAALIQEGDEDALEKLVYHNLPFGHGQETRHPKASS